MVQATGNNHAGGARGGLFMELKDAMASRVKRADTAPTIKGIAIKITSVTIFRVLQPVLGQVCLIELSIKNFLSVIYIN